MATLFKKRHLDLPDTNTKLRDGPVQLGQKLKDPRRAQRVFDYGIFNRTEMKDVSLASQEWLKLAEAEPYDQCK